MKVHRSLLAFSFNLPPESLHETDDRTRETPVAYVTTSAPKFGEAIEKLCWRRARESSYRLVVTVTVATGSAPAELHGSGFGPAVGWKAPSNPNAVVGLHNSQALLPTHIPHNA